MSTPRVLKRERAERDLDDIWFHIAEDNVDAADGVEIVRVLHSARDISTIAADQGFKE